MTHKLAKKLKNAGFPLKFDESGVNDYEEYNFIEPTLSELIEACGDRFGALFKTQQELFFCAEVKGDGLNSYLLNDMDTYSTPEEAVANLYIALHPIITGVMSNGTS